MDEVEVTDTNEEVLGTEEQVEVMPEEQTEIVETNAEVVPEVPAYVPNFKFKANKQEMEFDEVFRGLVTNEEMEKKVRDFHERYYGIDEVKKHRDEIRTNYGKFREQIDPVIQNLQLANSHYQRNDLDSAFQALGMDENKVLEWARVRQQLQHLSPEARAEYNRQREEERNGFRFRQEADFYRQQLVERNRESKIAEINSALSAPEVIGVQTSFDQRHGQGAFKRELIRRGQLYQAETGQDLPASQIAQELLDLFGGMSAPVQQTPQTSLPGQQVPARAVAPLKKNVPTLPATKSSGVSQVKATPRTFDEMIKMRDAGKL